MIGIRSFHKELFLSFLCNELNVTNQYEIFPLVTRVFLPLSAFLFPIVIILTLVRCATNFRSSLFILKILTRQKPLARNLFFSLKFHSKSILIFIDYIFSKKKKKKKKPFNQFHFPPKYLNYPIILRASEKWIEAEIRLRAEMVEGERLDERKVAIADARAARCVTPRE